MIGRNSEHNNGFWGMIGPGTLYLHKYNVILANTEAVNAVCAFDSGQGLCPPMGMSQWSNPRGFPMTICKLHNMVRDIKSHQPHWRNNLYLLREFYRILSSVQLEYHDLMMQTAMMKLNDDWADIQQQFQSLKPPDFIPMPAACMTSNPHNANHGAGLVWPINGTIDKWC
ncbi:hypothetical protein IW262DRAFT_1469164 [Armillaria fumosa]|nr:hypothetical protein IW262DRAFT_1469164 [Armillaria fumosa]